MSPSFPSLPILDPVLHPVCSVSPSLYPCLALVCFLDPLPLYLFLVSFSCFRVAVIFFFGTWACLRICQKPQTLSLKNAHLIGVYGQ